MRRISITAQSREELKKIASHIIQFSMVFNRDGTGFVKIIVYFSEDGYPQFLDGAKEGDVFRISFCNYKNP